MRSRRFCLVQAVVPRPYDVWCKRVSLSGLFGAGDSRYDPYPTDAWLAVLVAPILPGLVDWIMRKRYAKLQRQSAQES
jgi:hypothetical protein